MSHVLCYARRRTTGEEQGQAAFEFVLVMPFVFLLIFLATEATSVLRTWTVIENASREGARCAAVRKNTSQVTDCVVNRSAGILSAADVSIPTGTFPAVQPDGDVEVRVTFAYTLRSPLAKFLERFSGGSIDPSLDMTAHTHMRME